MAGRKNQAVATRLFVPFLGIALFAGCGDSDDTSADPDPDQETNSEPEVDSELSALAEDAQANQDYQSVDVTVDGTSVTSALSSVCAAPPRDEDGVPTGATPPCADVADVADDAPELALRPGGTVEVTTRTAFDSVFLWALDGDGAPVTTLQMDALEMAGQAGELPEVDQTQWELDVTDTLAGAATIEVRAQEVMGSSESLVYALSLSAS